MIELMELQIESIAAASKGTPIDCIYVDGGFVDNEVCMELLRKEFGRDRVVTVRIPIGSALGATIDVAKEANVEKALESLFSRINKQ